MKKILLASAALVSLTGAAMAEVAVSGDGRMGIIYDGTDWDFTSRIRITFTATGETDGGLAFGGSVRADNAGVTGCTDFVAGDCGSLTKGGVAGAGGSVYISGAFGKLSMGDVDSAAEAAIGQVSGVGLTGLGDMNEIGYLGAGASDSDPVLLYTYSSGDFTVYASLSDGNPNESYGVAFKYAPGNYSVSLGYEDNTTDSQIVVGGSATFGDATISAVYSSHDLANMDEYALSLDYVFGAATVTAFYHGVDNAANDNFYGLGASYDLGGGASIVGGVVSGDNMADPIMDFGISMTF
ncbi:porin [Frigidibacter sp. ROC022]|uniref:porin n=1 Tax=Frigidibacter sp. ROC022 TaxID=2971796 RepID=UPI00215AEF75|nr:porin [Frigidibacter sp. ROC022]MCR8724947.1 porin [Frigidibacter sp. ROC022]